MPSNEFAELMARFRNGDEAAAAALVRRFEPQIRRAIRVRVTGTRLQRVLDSAEVWQSVLRRLWENRADPDLPGEDPKRLINWLFAVARNRVREEHRRQRAAKRGGDRAVEFDPGDLDGIAADGKSPSSEVAIQDLLTHLFERLAPDERAIAVERAEGRPWEELAKKRGTTVDALRKRYQRAVQQVVENLTDKPNPHASE